MAINTTLVSKRSRSAARRIALARLISLTGSQAAMTALLFEIYRRTGSSRWIAVSLLVTFATLGILTPLAGSLGDRFDRRRVMIVSDLLGAACFASLAFAQSPLALIVLAFLASVTESPFFPAASAAVPNLVPADDLAWANGTISLGANIGYLSGPALGGLLVAAVGAPMVFGMNAVTFVVSAALVASVRSTFSGSRADQDEHRGVRGGFLFIWRDRVLRTMLVAFAVFAVCVGSVLVAELPLAESFHVGSFGFGLLSTCFGIGALGGALAGRRLTPATERRALVFGSFVTAVAFGGVSLMPAFAPVLAMMLLGGMSDGLVDIAIELIFQRRSPDAVRSRVVGALEASFLLGLAVSFLFAGTLIDAFGPKAAYVLAGGGVFVTALMLLPLLRSEDGSGPIQRSVLASVPEGDTAHRMADGPAASVGPPGS
jgi:MFS family permease